MTASKKLIIMLIGMLLCSGTKAQNVDIDLLEEINSDRDASTDPTFRFITNSVTPLTIATPVGFITYALIKKDSISKHNAINVCSSLIISSIISTGLKYLVHRTRPFVTYSFIQKETYGGSYSFPSGHTSAAFALATSVSIAHPKWYVIAPSYLWASAVAYSRMELGVHYPSDVLAGALIGSGSSILSHKLNKWVNRQHRTRHRR